MASQGCLLRGRKEKKNNRKCCQLADGNHSQSTPGLRKLLQDVGGMRDQRKRGHSRKDRSSFCLSISSTRA